MKILSFTQKQPEVIGDAFAIFGTLIALAGIIISVKQILSIVI